jgi:solute carrier family 25 (mitochondrial aspartate/glutamate transporter), member 12/13
VGGRYSVPVGAGVDLRCVAQRFLDRDNFVNAIAPTGDLTKIGRTQFAILFRVADTSKRGLISWSDFTVFETLLKRPDADYWMAFEYFDVYVPKI